MSDISVTIKSNRKEIQRLTAEAIQRGLEATGMGYVLF